MDKALNHLRIDRGYKDLEPLKKANIFVMNNMNDAHFKFKGHIIEKLIYNNPQEIERHFNKFILPISAPNGNIVSFVSYDLINKVDQRNKGEWYIPYSNVNGISKKNLIYVPQFYWDSFIKEDGDLIDTVYIVDGLFDAITMNACGNPTISLIGSTISKEVKLILNQFKTLVVIPDNDKAGYQLKENLMRIHADVRTVILPHDVKDIDEYIKKYKNKNIKYTYLTNRLDDM